MTILLYRQKKNTKIHREINVDRITKAKLLPEQMFKKRLLTIQHTPTKITCIHFPRPFYHTALTDAATTHYKSKY